MADISESRLSPQAAYMKVASLEAEKKILGALKNSSLSRIEGIKRVCGQIDERMEKITERESRLSKIVMRGSPQLAAGAAPASCKQVFEQMPSRFKRDAAGNLKAVYQFNLESEGGGKWHVLIDNGKCEVKEGEHPAPSITISMQAADFLALISGNLNPQMAFMTGKLKVAGDMSLGLKLGSLFDTSQPAASNSTSSAPEGPQTTKQPPKVAALKYGRR